MKIGDRIYVRGYVDEIRKDTVIVRNDGGYFGTIPSEVTPSAQPHTNSWYINSWCIDCKEYDTENKCCPRYNRVIKQTLDDAYRHGETEAEARYHAQQRWIPCSERLPEENGQYLITVKYVHVDGYDDIYAEHGEWTDGKWDMFCFGHCGKVENIIAWMPLPEPYREGES